MQQLVREIKEKTQKSECVKACECDQLWEVTFAQMEKPAALFLNVFNRQVMWFKDSGKIFETDRALMTVKGATESLKLSQLQPSDFGNYR